MTKEMKELMVELAWCPKCYCILDAYTHYCHYCEERIVQTEAIPDKIVDFIIEQLSKSKGDHTDKGCYGHFNIESDVCKCCSDRVNCFDNPQEQGQDKVKETLIPDRGYYLLQSEVNPRCTLSATKGCNEDGVTYHKNDVLLKGPGKRWGIFCTRCNSLHQIGCGNNPEDTWQSPDSPTTPEIKTLPRGSKRRYGSEPEQKKEGG